MRPGEVEERRGHRVGQRCVQVGRADSTREPQSLRLLPDGGMAGSRKGQERGFQHAARLVVEVAICQPPGDQGAPEGQSQPAKAS